MVPSSGVVGTTDPDAFLGLSLPIAGIAGDQQSALFGQTCFDVGDSKCTYGTGSFILTNTGSDVVRSDAGLLSTAAWRSPEGEMTYALEGAIFVTGAAVQWLRDGLGIIKEASETEALAASLDSNDGVYFVPALTGLGSPHWDPYARGASLGNVGRGPWWAVRAFIAHFRGDIMGWRAIEQRAPTLTRNHRRALVSQLVAEGATVAAGCEVSGAGADRRGISGADTPRSTASRFRSVSTAPSGCRKSMLKRTRSATEFELFGLPTTITTSTCGAMNFTASWRLVVA